MKGFFMNYKASFLLRMLTAGLLAFAVSNVAAAYESESADDRIKTMVYNENEVYTILTRNGFATAIELSRKEKVQAISIGDSVGWQITPAKNRLFIKPTLLDSTTNLSIITDKRTYQFELIVSSSRVRNAKHAYVVRFFYPSEAKKVAPLPSYAPAPVPYSAPAAPIAPSIPAIAPAPPAFSAAPFPTSAPPVPSVAAPISAPSGVAALPSLGSIGIESYNFNYTLTGPESFSPSKIFDDGKSTYFEFGNSNVSAPRVFAVTSMGTEAPLNVRRSGSKYIVDSIASRFVIRAANSTDQICIFNESMLAGAPVSASGANAFASNRAY